MGLAIIAQDPQASQKGSLVCQRARKTQTLAPSPQLAAQ